VKAVFPAMKAGGPHTLKVSGAVTATLQNVMIGDVWLCTGQSNMAGVLRSYMGDGYKECRHLHAGHPSLMRGSGCSS